MKTVVSPRRGPSLLFVIEFAPGIQATPTSLSIDDSVSFNDVQQLGDLIVEQVNSSAWMIGDWINALRRYRNRYPEGVERLELRYQTLRNCAWVASKVSPVNRFEQLSWSHHRAVASMSPEEQRLWLEDALRHGWTVSELEQEIRATRPDRTAITARPTSQLTSIFDPQRVSRWNEYADRNGMDVVDLVTKATDSYIQAGLA